MNRSMLVKSFLGVAVLLVGCLSQFNCAGALANVNPCGTIFSTEFCDPLAYSRLFGDFYESNFDADPTCVIPFLCGTPLDEP